jgi:hypothetical protein
MTSLAAGEGVLVARGSFHLGWLPRRGVLRMTVVVVPQAAGCGGGRSRRGQLQLLHLRASLLGSGKQASGASPGANGRWRLGKPLVERGSHSCRRWQQAALHTIPSCGMQVRPLHQLAADGRQHGRVLPQQPDEGGQALG